MKDMYLASSWGWHPEDKLEELFHPDARFILVRRPLDEGLGEVVAFLSFRFDMEEGKEVAYLYEVHVCSSCRRQGLGRILTDQLCRIASHYKMSSVIFVLHPTSPGYTDEGSESDEEWVDEDGEADDYRILYCPYT
ncbi:hypothetical protein K525DRAFT_256095 [Schizophyllum commune Loenen D]|nr:hypothetical protein K525DRAFT_256095 [Schizophyllum commune Loenen D]